MVSRFSLRLQLFASYLLLLTVVLAVIGAAMFIFFSTRLAPRESTYERLSNVMQGLNYDLMRETRTSGARIFMEPGALTELLDTVADTSGLRVMVVTLTGERALVAYDSSRQYDSQSPLDLYREAFRSRQLERLMMPRSQQIFGGFVDPDGQEWLYAGIGRAAMHDSEPINMLALAEPRSSISLQAALGTFSSALLPPFIRAGLVGLVVAFLLAFMTSRSLARPLQALAQAADAVAAGDYSQQVPERGPHEIRSLARVFNNMSAEVRMSQQSQRDFLANVSHDLKTPLTSIQGYSQAIMDGAAADPAQAASIIHDEAGRLNRMVIELADLMRMQSGRLSLKLSAVDVGLMTATISQRLALVADSKGVTLAVDSPSTPRLAVDGDRMAQVLTNLISNAINYTAHGGRVTVRTSQREGGVTIVVADNGVGIPAEDLPRIFERFYQVDKARGPQRGTGLGLAIAREIVQAHGGRIDAASEGIGKGAAFTVWLPLPDQPLPQL